LKNAKITVYDSNKCSNVYPSTTKNWDAQICAGICFNESSFVRIVFYYISFQKEIIHMGQLTLARVNKA
jgi:hypothetical protein